MARIAEKKQQRLQLSGVTWETTPLPSSSPTPMLSPNALEKWNEYRLKQEIAAKERTIDIFQVEKTSDAKANKLAAHKLEKIQAWNKKHN
ncbi:hypothetical protein FD724_39280 (plasmid) [Nostoc sp. C057]|uniref:hypothetical protein n=1 Tax=Nostoc sp. C057 TaxID=2576903 RepID=UPI0015C2C641|nr:hypothetical protein [Nostoc sp. C057]QLE53867.1 hypothetical protein FD724_39280 [Nostoc sp. C057]